jgi:hypothetical protein
VTASVIPFRSHMLPRALCVIVVLIVVIAAMYSAWIGINNFSRIGV